MFTFISKLEEFSQWMRGIRNQYRIGEIVNLVKDKLRGHYAYYGISDNFEPMRNFPLPQWFNRLG